jgi:hypothetical protein
LFDVDNFDIARAEAAQLLAYWRGIAFPGEALLSLVISRPAAAAAVVPPGDRRIGSGSKRNAIGHPSILFPLQNTALTQTSNVGLFHSSSSSRQLAPKKTRVQNFAATEFLASPLRA